MKRNQPRIKSKFNSNERFSYDKTPTCFESVTENSIDAIKKFCTEQIEEKYHGEYNARTLYAMVRTVAGNFDLLTSRLKADYGCRRANLKKAQQNGIKNANGKLILFRKDVSSHNMAFDLYNENVENFTGKHLDENLKYPQEKLDKYEKRLKQIKEKNHDA